MVIFRTPHKSAKVLKLNNRKGIKVMVRHGASKKAILKGAKFPFEINSIQAIARNANKAKMKEIFIENGISTPECFDNTPENRQKFKDAGWNVVYKLRNHHRGIGMELLSLKEIDKLAAPQYNNGLIERRINVSREWRVHCCVKLNEFYPLEKRRRHSAQGAAVRNIETCVFREKFDEPANWQDALDLCKKALEAIGLDTGGVDLAMTPQGKFYVIETNSGPSLGEKSAAWYQDKYNKLIDSL